MTRILYLVHDLDDPATKRRVEMLNAGGAHVTLAGFRRATTPLAGTATVLGHTYNGRFLQRGTGALRVLTKARAIARKAAPDVIIARSLEMLPLARRIQGLSPKERRPRLIYEVLDIHRLMIGQGVIPATLRMIEGLLCRTVDCVIVSSPRFEEAYFARYARITAPLVLVENKIWDPTTLYSAAQATPVQRLHSDTVTIGWFGILRCAASLRCLDALCRYRGGSIKLVLRGRPALDSIPDFQRIVDSNPHITFHGPYTYPDDLARIYSGIDIAWLIDRMDAGANSDWLLPNRLYESSGHGIVPLALAGTETGHYLERRNLGLLLKTLDPDSLGELLAKVDVETHAALRAGIVGQNLHNWRVTLEDCFALVDLLAGHPKAIPVSPISSIGLAR
jgi:succinoglycan biosynthesis protein ExoL